MKKPYSCFKKIVYIIILLLLFTFKGNLFVSAQTETDQNFNFFSNQLSQLIVFSATGSYYAYIYPVVNPENSQFELFRSKVFSASGNFDIGPFNQILQHGFSADGKIYVAVGIEIRSNNIYYVVYVNNNKFEYRLF